VQVEVALRHELTSAQAADETRIEANHGAFHVFGRVGDIEWSDAGDEIRKLGQRLGIGIDDRARGSDSR
jgi:hypothetical protein